MSISKKKPINQLGPFEKPKILRVSKNVKVDKYKKVVSDVKITKTPKWCEYKTS